MPFELVYATPHAISFEATGEDEILQIPGADVIAAAAGGPLRGLLASAGTWNDFLTSGRLMYALSPRGSQVNSFLGNGTGGIFVEFSGGNTVAYPELRYVHSLVR